MKLLGDAEELAQSKVNGAGATSDEPMMIDSEDEEPSSGCKPPVEDKVEFEEQEEEHNPSRPYDSVMQVLHLPLETQVLHLSFLHLPTDLEQSSLGSLPTMLLENMVVAVACSDCSVRVVTIPLTPPSGRSRRQIQLHNSIPGVSAGQGHHKEQMHILSSSNGHRSHPRGASMTLNPRSTTDTEAANGSEYKDILWDLLVASHSADMSGLMLIHRIPILADGTSLDTEGLGSSKPWRRQVLASPARAISFNTSLYPAMRHYQLLVAETKGSVRIFHCRPEADQGSWLVTLYSPVELSFTNTPCRKQLLTAQWVLGGKAVAVLLADGEWGIWEIEDSGPKAKQATDGWQASPDVFLDRFSISGWIDSAVAVKDASKNFKNTEIRSQLAPMTPATRKVRQESLFTGPTSKAGSPARGGMSVCPASNSLINRKDDETLLLWRGKSITVIPSLLTYWQNKIKRSGNLFGKGAQGQPKELNNIHLGGEIRNDVSLIPPPHTAGISAEAGKQSSILITGEYRILIVTPPLFEPTLAPVATKSKPKVRSTAADQPMLERGGLDVHAIDKVLTGMSNGPQSNEIIINGIIPKKQANRLIS